MHDWRIETWRGRRQRKRDKARQEGRGFKFVEGLEVKTAEYYYHWIHYTLWAVYWFVTADDRSQLSEINVAVIDVLAAKEQHASWLHCVHCWKQIWNEGGSVLGRCVGKCCCWQSTNSRPSIRYRGDLHKANLYIRFALRKHLCNTTQWYLPQNDNTVVFSHLDKDSSLFNVLDKNSGHVLKITPLNGCKTPQ